MTEYYQLINSSPDFVSFTLKRFVYLFGITLATPLFPLYFVRELDASDAWIGLLYTAQTAVSGGGLLLSGPANHDERDPGLYCLLQRFVCLYTPDWLH